MTPSLELPAKPYQAFAYVYDALMADVPYEDWTARALELWTIYGLHQSGEGTARQTLDILDLACGTGRATVLLASEGHRVTGVDLSDDMLAVADSRSFEGKSSSRKAKPLFVHGDMCELSLPARYDLVTCFCDGLNHLDNLAELTRAFTAVRSSLRPGGVFVFDLNTRYKLTEVLGNNTFTEDFDQGICIMDNALDARNRAVSICLTFFIEDHDGLYRRMDEEHVETWFEHDEVSSVLSATCLALKGCWAGYTDAPVEPSTERVVYVAVAV